MIHTQLWGLADECGNCLSAMAARTADQGDGTFGVYVLFSFAGRGDAEPVRKVLADESGSSVSFATEREAQDRGVRLDPVHARVLLPRWREG